MRLLLMLGAEVDRTVEKGKWKGATPLLVACYEGHVDAARLCLDRGADIDLAADDGWTPLFSAWRNGHVDAVRLLLDKCAEVDFANKNGATPLYIACKNGH